MKNPKELIIKSVGKDSNTATIFENPNIKLKKQIQDYIANYKAKKIKMGWPSKTYIIGELEGKEYRCTEGKNVTYFAKKEVDEALKEQILIDMNNKFNVFHHFADIFGTISNTILSKGWARIETLIPNKEKLNGFSMDGSYQAKNLAFFGDYYKREYNYSQYYDRYELKVSKEPSITGINMFFNEDGDIINRDYNFKLQDYEAGLYDASVHINELLNSIASYGDMEYVEKTQRLFGKEVAISLHYPEIEDGDSEIQFSAVVYRRRKNTDDISYVNNKKVIKKPTKTEKLTSEQVKIKILQFIPEDFLKNFTKIKE